MGKRDLIKPGCVVWATIADRSGRNIKNRPILLIPPPPNGPNAVLCGLAISTEPEDCDNDPAIVMPWNAANGDTTGLLEWCRVFLLWHVQVDQGTTKTTGRVTTTFLDEILSARDRALHIPH